MANYYNRNQPKYNWGDGWTKRGVTEKQASFLESLAAKTGVTLQNTETMTRGAASGLIDELKRMADGDQHSRRYLTSNFSEYVILQEER